MLIPPALAPKSYIPNRTYLAQNSVLDCAPYAETRNLEFYNLNRKLQALSHVPKRGPKP